MNYNTLHNLQMPYLQAIQRIPGNTASEKLKWIGKLTSNEPDAIGDFALLSPELLPLLQVEAAVKHKRHEDITSALMSDDSTIVNRASKASWFFDGNHKIVDVAYFCKRIFPFVSLRTRVRIVKTLARRVKNPVFAREMFTAVATTYGIKIALPLIVACDENFVHQLVIMRKIMLPGDILRKIFDRNFNLGVKFLKSFILDCKEYTVSNALVNIKYQHGIIQNYEPFLVKLAKKCPTEFVNIVDSLNHCPEINVLSNKSADQFLRKALYAVAQRPHLYMPILPPKAITAKRMEVIFPSLMINQNRDFCVDRLLSYLKNYPEDKRLALLLGTYRNIYQCELLHNMQNVTPTLLQLLPTKQRIAVARRLMKKTTPSHCTMDYKTAWLCYFPVNRVRCLIAFKMRQASSCESRLAYILQLIYNCKVNKDEDALYNTLTYIIDEKYVECDNKEMYEKIVQYVSQVCEIPRLSERNGDLVFRIIQSFYIKYGYVEPSILEDMVRFRLNHNRPIFDLIEMLLVTNDNYKSIKFNMITDNPQYERTCFINFLNVIDEYCTNWDEEQQEEENQAEEQEGQLEEEKISEEKKERNEKSELCRFIIAMYDFNDRCKNMRSKIKRLTITNYPWVMDACCLMMQLNIYIPFCKEARNVLRRHESDVYRCWFLSNIPNLKIASVTSGSALCLLKENFQSVLDNWEQYLIACKRNYLLKPVQHFVRAIRWYEDIPVKFAERCISDLCGRDVTKMSSALVILSILLHGDTMVKLINPFLFRKTERNINCLDIGENNLNAFEYALNLSIKLSNPPVPLSYVGTLFQGAYPSKALLTLASVSKRCSMSEITSFTENVWTLPADVRKFWIKMMNLAPTHDLKDFLHKMWTIERDYAVRVFLYDAVLRLFRERPGLDTLSLCREVNMTLTLEDNVLLEKMNLQPEYDVPEEYLERYFDIWLDAVGNLSEMGLRTEHLTKHIDICLKELSRYIDKSLSADYIENVFRNFLFHVDVGLCRSMRRFAIPYLISSANYQTYLKVITDILPKVIMCRWNVSHPRISCFFPLNNAVHLFFHDLIISCLTSTNEVSSDSRILDDLLNIFPSVLLPVQDAKSYLLLIYAKTLMSCKGMEPFAGFHFGQKLGRQMPMLVSTFSLYLIPFMVNVLQRFLTDISTNYVFVTNSIISGFIDANNVDSAVTATILLLSQQNTKEYDYLLRKLIETFPDNNIIATILYKYNKDKNSMGFNDIVGNKMIDG